MLQTGEPADEPLEPGSVRLEPAAEPGTWVLRTSSTKTIEGLRNLSGQAGRDVYLDIDGIRVRAKVIAPLDDAGLSWSVELARRSFEV